MTDRSPRPAPVEPDSPGAACPHLTAEAAGALSNQLVLTVKLLHQAKEHLRTSHGVEPPAYPLVFLLANGPRRVSDLAEAVHSDVSTVSRHTSTLVRHGLLEKVADENDRRVQLVTLTDAGHRFLADRTAERHEWFTTVLAGWDPADIDAFRAYLERFSADVQRVTAR